VCGHGEGVSRRRKARAARVPLRPWKRPRPPPRPRAGQPTVCVCATQPGALCGVCSSRGRGWERGAGEKGARTRCGSPFRLRILVCVRATAGLEEGARLGAKEMRRRSATASLRTGGLPADENRATGFPEPGGRAGSRRHASRPGPESLVRARLPSAPSAARVRSKRRRRKAAARRAPTAGEAHRMHARKPTLFKMTRCAQSPRRRACCKVSRLRRRGGRWVGEMGRGAGEGVATSTAAFPRRGRARAARSGLCRPPPGYFFASPG
jgi:hypothetical protein